jgi:hypothetical protein
MTGSAVSFNSGIDPFPLLSIELFVISSNTFAIFFWGCYWILGNNCFEFYSSTIDLASFVDC